MRLSCNGIVYGYGCYGIGLDCVDVVMELYEYGCLASVLHCAWMWLSWNCIALCVDVVVMELYCIVFGCGYGIGWMWLSWNCIAL